MKKLIVVLAILLCIGCNTGPDAVVRQMTAPVKVLAISKEGDVVIVDSKGDTATFPASYFFSKAISTSLKPGDIIK